MFIETGELFLITMGLFRSEDMTLCSLYLQADTAFAIIARLGELGLVQFRDVSNKVSLTL